jgi:hypothetical protein
MADISPVSSRFAAVPAVAQLADQVLAQADDSARRRWGEPMPLTSRIALFRTHGATDTQVRELSSCWDAWRAADR